MMSLQLKVGSTSNKSKTMKSSVGVHMIKMNMLYMYKTTDKNIIASTLDFTDLTGESVENDDSEIARKLASETQDSKFETYVCVVNVSNVKYIDEEKIIIRYIYHQYKKNETRIRYIGDDEDLEGINFNIIKTLQRAKEIYTISYGKDGRTFKKSDWEEYEEPMSPSTIENTTERRAWRIVFIDDDELLITDTEFKRIFNKKGE